MSRVKFEEDMERFISGKINKMMGEIEGEYPDCFTEMRITDDDWLGVKRKTLSKARVDFKNTIKAAIRWSEWIK